MFREVRAGPLPSSRPGGMCCGVTRGSAALINPELEELEWGQIPYARWENIPSLLVSQGSAPPNQ